MPSGFCVDCANTARGPSGFYHETEQGVVEQFRAHHLSSLSTSGDPSHLCHLFLIFSGDCLNEEYGYVSFASGKEDRLISRELSAYSTNEEIERFRSLHISLRRSKEGD